MQSQSRPLSKTSDRRAFLRGAGGKPAKDSAKKERRLGGSKPASGRPDVPELGLIALNRMGFGPCPGELDAFRALGSSDEQRLEAYVEQQLDPDSIDDTNLEVKLVEGGYSTLQKPLPQLWKEHVLDPPDYSTRIRPFRESERGAFLRALYSRRQLVEVLADFWHNHFNVYGADSDISPVFVHYDQEVIRGNMLGNFREMLEAVASSPAMLFFLDNYTNSNAGPNENYAWELFELHTLGARNYLGVGRQNDVPRDREGRPVGYVDDDVYEATRCFTGWTVNEETGGLDFRSDWHDRFQKNVLGSFFPPDQPSFRDGQDVLDLLAEHPGTARHVASKLCRRLIADRVSGRVVEQAAQTFLEHKSSPDQLTRVVRTILLSREFRTSFGRKVKRPFEVVLSFLRAVDADFTIQVDHRYSNNFLWFFAKTSHSPFHWKAPDGYPDTEQDWLSTPPLVHSWRLVNWLLNSDDDDGFFSLDTLAQTPEELRSAQELADYWIRRILRRPMIEEDRLEIIDFMAQGRAHDVPLRLDGDKDTQHRLRSMIALIACSPDFLWR